MVFHDHDHRPRIDISHFTGEGIVVSTEAKVEILALGEAAYWKWKELHSNPSATVSDPDAF